MSSISPNCNGIPNPDLSVIAHPSSSIPPKNSTDVNIRKKKRSSKKKKRSSKKKKRNPYWLDLPEDVWLLILSKLKTIHIIENVQKVCMLFRNLCKHPSIFNTIDMYLPDAFNCLPYNVNLMTQYAVDRSAGQLVDIYLEYLCDDETLMYIAERSPKLRCLRLGHYIDVSDEGLLEAVQKLPNLEEVQLIICSFSEETFEVLGRILPTLRSFSLTKVGSKMLDYYGNEEALVIARSMPELRHLQLIGNSMGNEGLKAILDGCPLLESLDLRACFKIDLSGDLGQRCKAIRYLRLPYDCTKDYGRQAYVEQPGFCFGFGYGYGSMEQESDYDYDGYPGFNKFVDLEDEYPFYFDDEYEFAPFGYDYFGLDGILDYGFSD